MNKIHKTQKAHITKNGTSIKHIACSTLLITLPLAIASSLACDSKKTPQQQSANIQNIDIFITKWNSVLDLEISKQSQRLQDVALNDDAKRRIMQNATLLDNMKIISKRSLNSDNGPLTILATKTKSDFAGANGDNTFSHIHISEPSNLLNSKIATIMLLMTYGLDKNTAVQITDKSYSAFNEKLKAYANGGNESPEVDENLGQFLLRINTFGIYIISKTNK
ncbi:hypothetical protein [Holophaga foetida]|uniref:hypothetical protein n=1 Tax=Holophaga foetida TaxID=35839 RepID=UPI0002473F5A|nr:hypothetical protein [Holophaga foetida]